MSWIGWVAAVLIGIIGLDVVFVCTIVTASWIRDWRERHEQRGTG